MKKHVLYLCCRWRQLLRSSALFVLLSTLSLGLIAWDWEVLDAGILFGGLMLLWCFLPWALCALLWDSFKSRPLSRKLCTIPLVLGLFMALLMLGTSWYGYTQAVARYGSTDGSFDLMCHILGSSLPSILLVPFFFYWDCKRFVSLMLKKDA